MAEGDITVYNKFKEEVLEGLHDLASGGDTIKISLHTGYTPDIDTHTTWADVSGTEYAAASGYSQGTLAGQDVTVDNPNDRALWDGTDQTFSSLGPLGPATPSHAIIWNDTHASDALICYVELGSTATNGGDYTLQWSSSPAAILSLS